MDRRLAAFGGTLMSLPVGYTFCPTDEIFVAYYLKMKALSRSRRNDVEVVPEFDVFSTDPRSLPSGGRVFLGNKFFFLNLKERVIEDNDKRPAGFGEWRTEAEVKNIYVANKNKLVGKRNKLQYWMRMGENFIRTRWIMHEYRLYLPDPSQMSPWAGYKIFQMNETPSKRARNASDTENSDDDDDNDDDDEKEEEEEKEVIIELKKNEEEPIEVNLAEESDSNIATPPSPGSSDSDSDSNSLTPTK